MTEEDVGSGGKPPEEGSPAHWRQRSLFSRTIITALFLAWLCVGCVTVFAGLLLLLSSVTLHGRLYAIAALLLSVAPLAFFRRRVRNWAWLGILYGLAGILFIAFRSPSFDRRYTELGSFGEGNASPGFFSPARLVPEIDQHLMGANLVSRLDPHIDREQARELKQNIRAVYEPMRENWDFAECGNALHLCYRDMFFGSRPYHHFSYIPHEVTRSVEAGERNPVPVVLFLHGSLGNFKGYMWQWKKLADEQGFAIVAPSHGSGHWNGSDVNKPAGMALKYIELDPRLDSKRVTLVGLSNGAKGVTQAALAWPKRFERIIYLSPVEVGAWSIQEQFAKAIGDTPILVISGRDDRRVPIELLEHACNDLGKYDVNLKTVFLPDRDHFLFFSDFDAVRSALE